MSTATAQDARGRLLADIPLIEHRCDLASVSTTVLKGGSGPPVVLLHGIGQTCFSWVRVIPELVDGYSLVVPDLLGHGASEIEDGRTPSADRAVEWLTALVDDTCAAPPVLVGHNIGGAAAARFAAEHSKRLAGLVLADAFGLGSFRPEPRFALTMAAFQMHATERSRDRMLNRCMVDFDGVQRDMGECWDRLADYALDRARAPGPKAAGRALMKHLGIPSIPDDDLDRIDVPTTLIWGRRDPETRLRFAERAAERHGWPLHILEDCGADSNLEHPDAFVTALRTALPAPH